MHITCKEQDNIGLLAAIFAETRVKKGNAASLPMLVIKNVINLYFQTNEKNIFAGGAKFSRLAD
jgi:hypothetical protein